MSEIAMNDFERIRALSEQYHPRDVGAELAQIRQMELAQKAAGLAVRSWSVQQKTNALHDVMLPNRELIAQINLGLTDETGDYYADFYHVIYSVLSFRIKRDGISIQEDIGVQRLSSEFSDPVSGLGVYFNDTSVAWTRNDAKLPLQERVLELASREIGRQEEVLGIVLPPLVDSRLNPEFAERAQQLFPSV